MVKQQGWFCLLLLGVVFWSNSSSVLCQLDSVDDILSNKFGLDTVDMCLNTTRDELLRLQYKAIVHQMLFADADTLASARLYIDDMLKELTAFAADDVHRRSRIAQAVVDLGRLMFASPRRLADTIEMHRRLLLALPDVQSKRTTLLSILNTIQYQGSVLRLILDKLREAITNQHEAHTNTSEHGGLFGVDHTAALSDDLANILAQPDADASKNSVATDVVLLINRVEVKAHRLVLAARSDFFK